MTLPYLSSAQRPRSGVRSGLQVLGIKGLLCGDSDSHGPGGSCADLSLGGRLGGMASETPHVDESGAWLGLPAHTAPWPPWRRDCFRKLRSSSLKTTFLPHPKAPAPGIIAMGAMVAASMPTWG